ncbi:MAG TPA: hypothetical protein VFF96_05845 [Pseudoxanthomonas sp.]|nr:hypothetical protein [Pseudoxanthomonas sp.]
MRPLWCFRASGLSVNPNLRASGRREKIAKRDTAREIALAATSFGSTMFPRLGFHSGSQEYALARTSKDRFPTRVAVRFVFLGRLAGKNHSEAYARIPCCVGENLASEK